tara:strand:+ start:1368 stop:2360 length:993 start_codon:yes stop_codon:yes gene_type:complete
MKKYISKNEKIFIAGSSGMAGNAIVRSLKKAGYGDKNLNGELLLPTRKELNLLNFKDVEEWFEINKPTVVIIAAAKVGGILANSKFPYEFLLENMKIQNNIIETSWRNKVKRLVFLGSSCIYPKYAQQPIREESLLNGKLEETNESYAIAKIAGIKLCESLRIQYGFDAISLMPTNLYGPNDNYHPEHSHAMASLISKFYNASINSLPTVSCWGSGSPEREFMHVHDLGEAVIFALEKWSPDSKDAPKDDYGKPLNFLNVGTGKDISIKLLAEKISSVVNFKGNIIWDKSKPDGTPKKQLDVRRILSLGWKPKISLEQGILETISSFNKK